MALQKQLAPLDLSKGLDTKLDAKQEAPGYLRKVENIVFETIKLFRKRNGYDALNLGVLSNGRLTGIKKLAKYQSELLALTGVELYSYSESRERWSAKGALYSAETVSQVVHKNSSSQTSCDGIVVDQFKVFTWLDTTSGVRYSVQDLNTNSFLVSDGLVDASGVLPVVANIQNDVYILYGVSTSIKFKSFSILEPQTLSAATTVATDRDASVGLIDCRTAGTAIAAAYNSTAAGANLTIFKINSDGSTSSLIGVTGAVASNALNVYCDSQSRILVTYSNGTTVKLVIYPFNLNASLLAPTTVDTANVSTCAAVELAAASYKVYYEVVQSGQSNNYVKQANVVLAGTVTNVAVFNRSVGLAADPLKIASNWYVPTVHESATQSTYFLLDSSANLVTKWANQTASSVITTGVLPSSSLISASKVLIGGLFRNRLQADGLTFFSTNGVGAVTIDLAPETYYSNAELAFGLHICAGVLKLYDGNSVTEHGYNVFPEGLIAQATATTGGFLANGNRGYKAVYKWTDNTGRDHRSAPTLQQLDVVLSGGTSTQTSTIRVPTLRLTEKTSVIVELYRTEDNGTTYYKVTSDLTPVLNDKTADYVDIVDTLSDTNLISKESLYTTGDVLENVPAPAAFQVSTYNGDRLAVVGEQGNRVFFSKQITEEQPVEFTDIIYRDVDPVGGPITAIRNMASKLIVFEKDATFYISGEGPTNTGVQDTITKAETLATDLGCINPDSAVLTPAGLMFNSRKGIWFCAGSLAMSYIGDRVEAYNGIPITAASIVGQLNQIRFLLEDSRALVYNYNLNLWDTFENHGGLSSVVIGDEYFYLRSDGAIWQENRSSFADAGSVIKMRIETGWLSPGDLQGFARAYHTMVLAAYKSPHKLRLKVAYDFIDAWVQDVVIDPLDFINGAAYGDESPYGSGSPYGGPNVQYQARVDFERQKCQAMKLSLEDVQSEAGEGLTLSALTFRVGTKQGSNKLQAAQQYGTSGDD